MVFMSKVKLMAYIPYPKGIGVLRHFYKSCEMISNDLYLEISKKYPNRKIKIEISEDGECGSYIEYE